LHKTDLATTINRTIIPYVSVLKELLRDSFVQQAKMHSFNIEIIAPFQVDLLIQPLCESSAIDCSTNLS